MKISQEDGILVKKISVKAVWYTKAVAWMETWKHRQSAKERIRKTGIIVRQPRSARPR